MYINIVANNGSEKITQCKSKSNKNIWSLRILLHTIKYSNHLPMERHLYYIWDGFVWF